MEISDIFALLQVILAVVAVGVDILLAYVAHKVDKRSKENHLNIAMSTCQNEEQQINEEQQSINEQQSVVGQTDVNSKKIRKIKNIFDKIQQEYKTDGGNIRISAKNLVYKLDNFFSEREIVKLLMLNKQRATLQWTGALSAETIITITNVAEVSNSFCGQLS